MAMYLRWKFVGDITWTTQEIDPITYRKRRIVERVSGLTLRKKGYGKRLSQRYIHYLDIISQSNDDTDPISGFWAAHFQQISFIASPDPAVDTDGIDVMTDGGEEPIENIEGLRHLKNWALKLTELDPFF